MEQDEELENAKARLSILETAKAKTNKLIEKYKKMSFIDIMQCPENLHKLMKFEMQQQEAFFKLISKRDELQHLKEQKEELFGEYFQALLSKRVVSINDFFYEDRLAPVQKRVLRVDYR